MANDKAFRIKNGLSAVRYLGSSGADGSGSIGYALSNASYDSKSFSVATQETSPFGLAFKSDGTKMYVVGPSSDTVYQYTLSTAYDVSTASYDSVSFSVASQDTTPFDLTFKPDGTKMYVVGSLNDSVYQYSLSTAWDLSTASYDSVSFSAASQDGGTISVLFNADGSKMYILGADNGSLFQYSLSTNYDISTASYDSVSFSFTTQNASVRGVDFNSDGTKLFMLGLNTNLVYQYSLSTAFDLSTTSYDSVTFGVGSEDSQPSEITFSTGGAKMFIVGAANDTVYQYSTALPTQTLDLSTGNYFSFTPSGATTVSFTGVPASGTAVGFSVEVNGDGSAITWPTSVKWHLATAPTATANKELYTFVTTDGGTTYYGKKAAEGLA